MIVKLSDFVADFFVKNGIKDLFTIVGGGSMHLNDSFGHKEGLHCIYCHHEQACAIAAEAYARVDNRIAGVCVTTGPGGINALNGVAGAYVDSIPMFVVSGQVKYETTVEASHLPLRAVGDQEFPIVRAVASMTKYAVMVTKPNEILYHLKKALYLATHGRRGPVWLDIPTDVQSAKIDTTALYDYNEAEDAAEVPPPPTDAVLDAVLQKIKKAKRPVLYAGSAIRWAGVQEEFLALLPILNIPVVTGWNSIDVVHDLSPYYVGRAGIMGDRAGNFAVQNADLVVSLGCRLSIRQVGYDYKTWAREAEVIMVDIDQNELKKPTIHVDMPIHADVKDVILGLLRRQTICLRPDSEWNFRCQAWKAKYPVITRDMCEREGLVNPYHFLKCLGGMAKADDIIVVGNGTACVAGSHAFPVKKGQRFLINSGMASMGYDLPAAVGTAIATGGKRRIILITGDGSIQMNLQELQTILTNRLDIRIFLINNFGYHSLRLTQSSFFATHSMVGVGEVNGDLEFPDMGKIARAYGYPFRREKNNLTMRKGIVWALKYKGSCVVEFWTDPKQRFEPKSSSKLLESGKIVSPPLEDLAPFLPREELKENMLIPLVEEE